MVNGFVWRGTVVVVCSTWIYLADTLWYHVQHLNSSPRSNGHHTVGGFESFNSQVHGTEHFLRCQPSAIQNIFTFYGSRSFITVFATAGSWKCPNWHQYRPHTSVLFLFGSFWHSTQTTPYNLPYPRFLSGFPTNIVLLISYSSSGCYMPHDPPLFDHLAITGYWHTARCFSLAMCPSFMLFIRSLVEIFSRFPWAFFVECPSIEK